MTMPRVDGSALLIPLAWVAYAVLSSLFPRRPVELELGPDE